MAPSLLLLSYGPQHSRIPQGFLEEGLEWDRQGNSNWEVHHRAVGAGVGRAQQWVQGLRSWDFQGDWWAKGWRECVWCGSLGAEEPHSACSLLPGCVYL